MQVIGLDLPQINARAAKVLDIGCGQGWAVLEAVQLGARAYGLDLSPELLSQARTQFARAGIVDAPLALAKSNCGPFVSESFDLIICSELIEHTFETDGTLAEISRLLKPGGHLVLSFPTMYVENIIARFSGEFLSYSGHVRQFTPDDMKHRLARQGLHISQQQGRYFEWSVYWLLRAILGTIPNHDRRFDRYGLDAQEDSRWETFDYYYKRGWKKLVRWKIGIPLLWLGNLLFPKSYVLICTRAGG